MQPVLIKLFSNTVNVVNFLTLLTLLTPLTRITPPCELGLNVREWKTDIPLNMFLYLLS